MTSEHRLWSSELDGSLYPLAERDEPAYAAFHRSVLLQVANLRMDYWTTDHAKMLVRIEQKLDRLMGAKLPHCNNSGVNDGE